MSHLRWILLVLGAMGCGADSTLVVNPHANDGGAGRGGAGSSGMAGMAGMAGTAGMAGMAGGGGRADGGVRADAGGGQCPADLQLAEGQPCPSEGQTCGSDCTDRCQFCNILRCESGHWTHLEAFPDPSCGRDGGGGGSEDGGRRDGGGGSRDGGRRDGGGGSADAGTCASTGSTSGVLPGVRIDLAGVPCSLTLAQVAAGVALPYRVQIAQATTGVVPAPGDAGNCARPGPSGLIVAEEIYGNGQRYCLCDTGLCMQPSQTPVTLPSGDFASTFAWQGRNWSGPSDTGNPMGAAFPPGIYTFKVSARGTRQGAPFEVSSTFSFTLTP